MLPLTYLRTKVFLMLSDEGGSVVLAYFRYRVDSYLYTNTSMFIFWELLNHRSQYIYLHDYCIYLIWLVQFWTFLNFNAFEGVISGGENGVCHRSLEAVLTSGINLNFAEKG